MHNGYIGDFHDIRRELTLAIDPRLLADIHGSTDTEVVFQLALTFGLEEDPIGALERTVGLIESTAGERGAGEVQGQLRGLGRRDAVGGALRDRGQARSLFASSDIERSSGCIPTTRRLRLSNDDRLIVSEPFADLPGALAGDPAVERGDGPPRRRARAPAVQSSAGRRHRHAGRGDGEGDRRLIRPPFAPVGRARTSQALDTRQTRAARTLPP